MASSPARRRRPRLPLLVLLVLLLATLSPPRARARAGAGAPAPAPAVAASSSSSVRARQEFHVAPMVAAVPTRTRRPAKEGRRGGRAPRRGRGGGTGAWAFSAMLPRGFVPPSGSSACHNDMPATAVDAQFFACSRAGSP